MAGESVVVDEVALRVLEVVHDDVRAKFWARLTSHWLVPLVSRAEREVGLTDLLLNIIMDLFVRPKRFLFCVKWRMVISPIFNFLEVRVSNIVTILRYNSMWSINFVYFCLKVLLMLNQGFRVLLFETSQGAVGLVARDFELVGHVLVFVLVGPFYSILC